MPNWCQNAMLVTGSKEQVEKMIAQVKSEESDFDFNNILRMPESLSVESSSIAEQAYAYYYGNKENLKNAFYASSEEDLQKRIKVITDNPNAKQLADTYHHNLQNYGVTNWYQWCPKNWGTKWNACDPHVDEIVKSSDGEAYQVNIFFNTAWSYPEGIFEELSRQYPELLFEVEVDEEGGYFWGKLTIQEGVIAEDLQEGTRPGGPYDYSDEEEDDE